MRASKGTEAVFLVSETLLLSISAIEFLQGKGYPGYSAIMGAVMLSLPLVLEMTGWVKLPLFLQVGALVALGLHNFGLLFGFYNTVWWWDKVTHVVSSTMVGLLAAVALYLFDVHSVKIKVPRLAYPFIIVIFSLFIGVVWETGEFVGDILAATRMQYSAVDTLGDCFVDMVGGIVAGIIWVQWLWQDPGKELENTAQERLIARFRSAF